MATTLSTGSYHIRSMASATGEYVGREPSEEKSNSPKKIVSLPADVAAQAWNIEALPNGAYKLTRQAPTGVYSGQVYAFLLTPPAPEEWVIKRIPRAGDHAYVISAANGLVWVIQGTAPHSQISCIRVRVPETISPTLHPTELWEITPA